MHVLVSKSREGDRVVYRYRVLNGHSELSALAIGWDDLWPRAELRVDFDSLICESPWDWTCESKWYSDGERGYVAWQSLNGYNAIPPNEEVACFSLSAPSEDLTLEHCHWTTNLDLQAVPKYSGTLITDTERAPVQVLVTKKPRANGVEYQYRVVNGSVYPITSVWVGVDEHCAPSGELFIIDDFPPGTSTAPGGWTFDLIPTEEDSMGSIRWEIDGQSDELPGGRELNGLSVMLPAEEPAYESGHWMVILNSARRATYVGSLEPGGDAMSPASSIFSASDVELLENHGSLSISFQVPVAGWTTIDLLNPNGHWNTQIVSDSFPSGQQTIVWDGTNRPVKLGSRDYAASTVPKRRIPSGNYILHIQTPISERFVRLKWRQ